MSIKVKQPYECSHCGDIFKSGAKPGNVRHKCKDGKTGVGKDSIIGKEDYVEEPEGNVELVKNTKDVEDVKDVVIDEEIPGDVEFSVEGMEEEGEDFDVGSMPGVEPPKEKPRKSKPTLKQDRNKIQSFIRGIYALTGQVDLTPDEETEILADIWAGVGEVHVDAPAIMVGGRTYLLVAGIITAGLMGRRALIDMNKARAYQQATPKAPKPLEPHEGWT